MIQQKIVTEVADSNSFETAYLIADGDTFEGNILRSDTRDYVRVELDAGVRYRLDATTSRSYISPEMELYDSQGTLIARGTDLSAGADVIYFKPQESGSYYLSVRLEIFDEGPNEYAVGPYSVTLGNLSGFAPSTVHDIADYLREGYWLQDGESARSWDPAEPIRWAFAPEAEEDMAALRPFINQAFAAWAELTGLQFQFVGLDYDTGDIDDDDETDELLYQGTETYVADTLPLIQFYDRADGAYAWTDTTGGTLTRGNINLDPGWVTDEGDHTYGYTTILHEIGHILGLGHAGPYNGEGNYYTQALFEADTWRNSIMSYFSPGDLTGSEDFEGSYAITPMLADIIAMQEIYGWRHVNAGDNIYGVDTTETGSLRHLTSGAQGFQLFTIHDTAGNDLLDYSRSPFDSVIDMRAGHMSSAWNVPRALVLSFDTVIEQARGSHADDLIIGNDVGNLIEGHNGDDTILGNEGGDTLLSGDGADRINGGAGDDFIYAGHTLNDMRDEIYAGAGNDWVDAGYGNDLVFGMDGDDTIEGSGGADTLHGQNGNDALSGAQLSDALFGGAGNDWLNGGFGFDRLNGGDGADVFYHMGVAGHGTDWVQDYSGAEMDVLVLARAGVLASDLRLSFGLTEGAGAADVAEAFVTDVASGQILWALVDAADEAQIWARGAGGTAFDLSA